MAVMDALLRIKAAVTGGEAIQQLGARLGKLNSTANQVGGGLSRLAGSAQGLVGGLGALVPLASGAGLMALAKSSIDAADNMNDLRQKTGASVESLSQFQQAAEKSGTTLDAVGGAMVKLNRNLAEGKAGKSLQEIGISATDASGKLKSTDQIMLELAGKFEKMPDGAEKTALAMDLFGKSGAALIPMLNMGDEAIKKLGVTMTGEFAAQADELNDKFVDLQTGVTRLAVGLGTALMPALQVVTDALIGALNIFTQLPGPLQAIVGGFTALVIGLAILAPAITAVVTIITALTALPVAATIAGWLGAAIPAVASITSALVGLLAFMTSTFLPGMIAVFTGPVGWTILAVAAVTAMVIAFRKPIGEFLAWLGQNLQTGLKVALDIAYKVFVQPWVTLFNLTLRQPISNLFSWMVGAVRAPLQAIGNFVRDVFNGILNAIASGINAAVGAINTLIRAYNSLPTPDLPLVPAVSVPRFAEGGVVDRPTLAMVGEGGEREYIIPESKMAAASARYLAGTRGDRVVNAGPATINVTTGPVMQAQGQQWVTLGDLERAMRQTETTTLARIRTFYGRRSMGIA